MKTELKAKFLQHILNKKKNEEGFTLIELLVVIIIIGILSAIALPSFLNQANKAKQSEAKTYVGSMNRGQQAYYTENSAFAPAITDLGIGVSSSTANYVYATTTGVAEGVSRGHALSSSSLAANVTGLRNYGGRTYLTAVGPNSELTTVAFLCETKEVGVDGAGVTQATSCNTGTSKAIK